jgi:hypothetical protein
MAIDRAGYAAPWGGATGGLIRVASVASCRPPRARARPIDPIDAGAGGVAPARAGAGRGRRPGRAISTGRSARSSTDRRCARIPIPRWADGQALAQWSDGADRVDGLRARSAAIAWTRALPALDPAAAKRDRRRRGRRAAGGRVAASRWRRGEARAFGCGLGLDRRVTREQRFGAVPARGRHDHAVARARGPSGRRPADRRSSRWPVLDAQPGAQPATRGRGRSRSRPARATSRSSGSRPGDDVAADAWAAHDGRRRRLRPARRRTWAR